jgi:hypothetical protein
MSAHLRLRQNDLLGAPLPDSRIFDVVNSSFHWPGTPLKIERRRILSAGQGASISTTDCLSFTYN